ncbi:vacuolar membrane protein-domain-containing protein [Cokeromyces recurvatus]|uniref:vacuolar membrane protein-domain-containing protein n=1 Tax=Cokeromyces recurvatus TaxID=90255 RepID=UPI0022209C5A|nr:vacuolar membrane protein-domain-containing protein [Cokeromyces recurvatus]KAI7898888.1 vacuolar membrane protein-domain-containing protein [Cokeromyces recurvatus]
MVYDYDATSINEDESGCQLLDGFAIFIQLVLAALAFLTLIIKRQKESPQRPLLTWSFDVSKQVIGGAVVHTLNLVASHIFGKNVEEESNPCVWYFLNIFVDTTLGVLVIWAILSIVKFFVRFYRLKGFQSGVYGEPPITNQMKNWTKQLVVYIMTLITMKIVVVILFSICPWLESFGKWVLSWTMGNYRIQVVFVMLIFPLIMNIVQFWIIDTIVKHKVLGSIRLSTDEELSEDMLISDGEYNTDDVFFNENGSEEGDANSISSIKIHTTNNNTDTFEEENSIYELRTSHVNHSCI